MSGLLEPVTTSKYKNKTFGAVFSITHKPVQSYIEQTKPKKKLQKIFIKTTVFLNLG